MNTDGITPNINPVADPFLAGYSAEHSIATRNLIAERIADTHETIIDGWFEEAFGPDWRTQPDGTMIRRNPPAPGEVI